MHIHHHSQNLTEDHDGQQRSILWNGRAWLYFENAATRTVTFHTEWCLGRYARHCHMKIGFNDHECQVMFSLSLPFLFTIYLMVDGLFPNHWLPGHWVNSIDFPRDGNRYYQPEPREFGFRIHDGAIWFSLWEHPTDWSRTDPWWWHFSFNPADFFLGAQHFSESDLSVTSVCVKLPEGEYPATVRMHVCKWKRPRWPWSRRMVRADVQVLVPIPVPGKGENSYDLDDDAIYSLTCPALTPEDAVKQLVESIARRRLKYGGRGWTPAPNPLLAVANGSAPTPVGNGGAP